MGATPDTNLPFGNNIDSAAIKRVMVVDSTGAQKLLAPFYTASFLKPDVTAAGTSGAWTTANSPITLFTVSGLVLCRVYGRATTLLTSTANTGTLAVGITGTTTLYLGTTTANGSTNFIANAIWVDTAPTVLSKALAAINSQGGFIAASNSNIILTIATNNMTAGGIELYCDWIPVSASATVTAATP